MICRPDEHCGRRLETLRAGWLIDGTGGAVKRDQLITVQAGKIRAVESFKDGDSHPEPVKDLSHCTLLPALMDAHAHLTFSGTLDPDVRKAQLGQSVQAAYAAIDRHLEDCLNHGVLAVRHGGDRRGDLRRFVQQRKPPIEVLATGWGWHAPGRYGRMIGRAPAETEELADAVVRDAHHGDHIKIINSGINSLDCFGHETRPQFSQSQLKRLCRYARQKELTVMVHANGYTAVKEAIEAGCHSIEHGYFMGTENMQRMAERGVVWVPTAVPMDALTQDGVVLPKQRQVARKTLDHQLDQIAEARHQGVTIALGTDAGSLGVDHGVAVSRELALLLAAGLTITEAVRCATLTAARLMGLKLSGAILPGWRADFIVVKGGPEKMPSSLSPPAASCRKGYWHVSPTVA